MDWIRADINGDGVTEYVPRADGAGTVEPHAVYALFTAPAPRPRAKTGEENQFYVGGSIYGDWASVPESYKVSSSSDAPGSAAFDRHCVFKFTW